MESVPYRAGFGSHGCTSARPLVRMSLTAPVSRPTISIEIERAYVQAGSQARSLPRRILTMSESNLGNARSDRSGVLRGFYLHAATFAIVNLILLAINLKKSPGYLWIKWVLLDWGVGLASHAWLVFGPRARHGRNA
jgi:hypothetical protein